jgi:hypothetical protein
MNRTIWRRVAAILWLAAEAHVSLAQQTKIGSAAAVSKGDPVKRLAPSEVPGLPGEFVEKLNARGCTIPKFDVASSLPAASSGTSEVAVFAPTNVIHGEFARAGQEDWAVLCSNGKSSTIVIFWGRETACPGSLARLEDAHYLTAANGKGKSLHYSRAIRALGENDLSERTGMSALRPLAHQGIDDRFVGKSSSFFYCNEGKWRIFPAKDSAGQ